MKDKKSTRARATFPNKEEALRYTRGQEAFACAVANIAQAFNLFAVGRKKNTNSLDCSVMLVFMCGSPDEKKLAIEVSFTRQVIIVNTFEGYELSEEMSDMLSTVCLHYAYTVEYVCSKEELPADLLLFTDGGQSIN